MPKYLSGRAKRVPQDQLSEDRYQYLGLDQAEPNLSDPLVSPSVPSGAQYQLVAVPAYPGKRYWVPVGGGLVPGAITIFDEDSPVSSSSSITQLNFVGAAVTANVSVQSPSGHPGIAATVTVIPVSVGETPPNYPTPNEGELWWESDTGDLYIYYDDGDSAQWVMTNAGGRGLAGDKGQKGEVGQTGLTGSVGDKGDKGEKGQKGDVEAQGNKGQKGEIGVGQKGQKGEAGADGTDGDKGQKGEDNSTKGQKGELGIGQKGQKGEKGINGGGATVTISDNAPGSASAGDMWWDSDDFDLHVYYGDGDSNQWVSITSNAALKGQKGEKGEKGQKGIGEKGQKGEDNSTKGQKGEDNSTKGQKGEVGDKGQKGEDNSTKGQKGESGAGGTGGDKGQKGQKGEDNSTKGQKGEVGTQGNQGSGGSKGEKGQKGQIGADGGSGADGTKGQKGEVGAQGTGGSAGGKGQKGEGGAGAPVGQIVAWSGSASSLPSGYFLCDGSAVSRTTYAALYSVVGTTHGSGNGSTTFNLPDLRSKFIVGASASGGYSVANTGGSADAVLVSHTHNLQDHVHGVNLTSNNPGDHDHNVDVLAEFASTHGTWQTGGGYRQVHTGGTHRKPITSDAGGHTHTVSGNTGASVPNTTDTLGESATNKNLPPYYALAYIIHYAQGGDAAKGQKGEIGQKGQKGEQNDKGQKGETGTQGTGGDKGQKGEVGTTGASGNNDIRSANIAVSSSEENNSSSNFQEKLSLSINTTSTSRVLVHYSFEIKQSSTNNVFCTGRLNGTNTSMVGATNQHLDFTNSQPGYERINGHILDVSSYSGTRTYKIQFNNSGTGYSYMKNATLVLTEITI